MRVEGRGEHFSCGDEDPESSKCVGWWWVRMEDGDFDGFRKEGLFATSRTTRGAFRDCGNGGGGLSVEEY